ncbi:MAG TPA: 5'/3'-nucleotidase SurE [Candidatus Glassbacteria bacterium]|nr:5'/3'-nucleotidase SurE [Candidatus Glassbacteria bacterium]
MGERVFLLTNDDGYRARGLAVLADLMRPLGRVLVVAPEVEQSACSHAITLHRPLRINQFGTDCYAVDGTPSDCVLLASQRLLDGRLPDMVLSGINHGPNLGDDVTYSGTVAGAFEGCLLGSRAVAVSSGDVARIEDGRCREILAGLLARLLDDAWPVDVLFNINLPASDLPLQGTRFTKLGRRHYAESVIEKTDPRGKVYYWIGGVNPDLYGDQESDFHVVGRGYVSVTPLHLDLTHYPSLEKFRALDSDLKS